MRPAPNLHRIGSDHVDSYLFTDAGGMCRIHGRVCGLVATDWPLGRPHCSTGPDPRRRKLTEHKTPKEARRSLKRRLSNTIYRRILADHQRNQMLAA